MAISKYFYANLDVGHYTAAGGDAVAFIKTYHDRITNLHFKDMEKNQPTNGTSRSARATRRSRTCCC